jgi:uncharacterized Zn finger protein
MGTVIGITLFVCLIIFMGLRHKILWCPNCGKFLPMKGLKYPFLREVNPAFESKKYFMKCRYCGHKWEAVYKVDKDKFGGGDYPL